MLYTFPVILDLSAILIILESRHKRYNIEILESKSQLHNICKDRNGSLRQSIKEMLSLVKYLVHEILHTAFD